MVPNAFIDGKMCTNKALGGGLKVQQIRKIVATNADNNATTTGLAGVTHPKNGKHMKEARRSKSAVVGLTLNLRDKLYIRRSRSGGIRPQQPLKDLKNVKMAGVATTTFNSGTNLHVYNGSDAITTGLAGVSHPKNGKHMKEARRSKSAVVGVTLNLRDKLYIRRSRSGGIRPQQPLKDLKNVKMAGVATTTFNSGRNLHVYNGSGSPRPN